MGDTQRRGARVGRVARAVAVAALGVAALGPVGPAFAAGQGPAVVRQADAAQTDVGGGVTVKVSRLDAADAIAFKVVLDTHVVNLDQYDLAQLAVLRTAGGTEVAPVAWDAPAGGHHREGTLSFPLAAEDGSSLLETSEGHLVLVIRDVAGVAERAFHWSA
jgi:hypothetical protein